MKYQSWFRFGFIISNKSELGFNLDLGKNANLKEAFFKYLKQALGGTLILYNDAWMLSHVHLIIVSTIQKSNICHLT